MKKDKMTEFIFAIIIFLVSFFNLFLSDAQIQKYVLSVSFLIYTMIVIRFMQLKKVDNINKKNIIILVLVLSIIHIGFLYFIGIWAGFYKNSNSLNFTTLYTSILPYAIIAICSEIIRKIFITRQNKKNIIIVTIALILAEVTAYFTQYSIKTLSDILVLIGYISLPAISTNILCNYMVKRYGLIPNIIYRIITSVYIYIFTILPDIYIFFQSVYRMVYPYFVYMILSRYFENNKFEKAIKNKKRNLIMFCICTIIIVVYIMLVSCEFKYGILVVGSSSMAGVIDKGDAVVYEQYKNQPLEKGQVIVFIKDNKKMIHGIEDIQIRNDETIYYTKGSNNQQQDEGYRTTNDIIGVVKFKIIKIGWPTIWVNDLFHK